MKIKTTKKLMLGLGGVVISTTPSIVLMSCAKKQKPFYAVKKISESQTIIFTKYKDLQKAIPFNKVWIKNDTYFNPSKTPASEIQWLIGRKPDPNLKMKVNIISISKNEYFNNFTKDILSDSVDTMIDSSNFKTINKNYPDLAFLTILIIGGVPMTLNYFSKNLGHIFLFKRELINAKSDLYKDYKKKEVLEIWEQLKEKE